MMAASLLIPFPLAQVGAKSTVQKMEKDYKTLFFWDNITDVILYSFLSTYNLYIAIYVYYFFIFQCMDMT